MPDITEVLMVYKELMMGVLIASTAFCGLTGVVIGQIKESNLGIFRKKPMRLFLLASFVLGVVTVVFTITWFSAPFQSTSWHSPTVLCPWLLFVQIILFITIIVDFWLLE